MKKRAREESSEVAVGTSAGAGAGVGVDVGTGDEQWLVFQGVQQTLQFWDANTFCHIKSLPIRTAAEWFGFSPDNKLLAVAFSDPHEKAQLWHVSTSVFSLEWEIPKSSLTTATAFNSQMTKLACKAAVNRIQTGPSSIVTVWDFISRTAAFAMEINGYSTPTVCFGVNGSFLLDICTLLDSGSQLLTAWNADTGTQMHQLDVGDARDPGDDVTCLALSPSGELAATGSGDRRVVVVDLQSWTQRACLTAHTDIIYSLAFSPDSGRLVTSSLDHFVIVWSTESWTELVRIDVCREVECVAISPDGNRIACMSMASQGDSHYYAENASIPEIFDAWTGKFLGSTTHSRDAPATSSILARICYSNAPMTILL
jgi:WD40 repeat protein